MKAHRTLAGAPIVSADTFFLTIVLRWPPPAKSVGEIHKSRLLFDAMPPGAIPKKFAATLLNGQYASLFYGDSSRNCICNGRVSCKT